MTPLHSFYRSLLAAHGPQGWWPLLEHDGTNPTKTGAIHGYHPGDYTLPRTERQRFEIGLGAILTQNTAWPNAEKALLNLEVHKAIAPAVILETPDADLKAWIRPAGFFNAKSRKLREFSRGFLAWGDRVPERQTLLGIWGIGPETADSIRLYAYGQLEMVVDAYTRRILEGERLVPAGLSYEAIKGFCEEQLPAEVPLYQEFHALMVEHAKRGGRNGWKRQHG